MIPPIPARCRPLGAKVHPMGSQAIDKIRSHSVLVCPGFECGAQMAYLHDRFSVRCLNGCEWTMEQIAMGQLTRPYAGGRKALG